MRSSDLSFACKLEERGIGFETGRQSFSTERPTLVMVHGAGGCFRIWQAQIHLLKNGINTLALDLPGHGQTPDPRKKTIKDYAAWLAELLGDAFTSPVYLMGHSMGGAIVQEMAIAFPEMLEGIVLVGTGARLPVAPALLSGMRKDFETTVDAVMRYAYAPGVEPSFITEGARMMKATGAEAVVGDFEASNAFDRSGDAANISLPCLIVCGKQDRLTPPQLSETLQASIKGSQIKIIPDSGHMVMIERYEAFNQCVRDFIDAST
jgi:pimeloyl-ACP methyl ester carboxylesterase